MTGLGVLDGGLMVFEDALLTDEAGLDCCCLPAPVTTCLFTIPCPDSCPGTLLASIEGLDVTFTAGFGTWFITGDCSVVLPCVLGQVPGGDFYRALLQDPDGCPGTPSPPVGNVWVTNVQLSCAQFVIDGPAFWNLRWFIGWSTGRGITLRYRRPITDSTCVQTGVYELFFSDCQAGVGDICTFNVPPPPTAEVN